MSTGYDGGVNTIGMSKKTWVRKEKIIVVGKCKYCQKEMTNEDFRSVGNFDSSIVKKPNFASSVANKMGINDSNVGISLDSIPGFNPSKAKAILDAANKKSKERAGV